MTHKVCLTLLPIPKGFFPTVLERRSGDSCFRLLTAIRIKMSTLTQLHERKMTKMRIRQYRDKIGEQDLSWTPMDLMLPVSPR